MQKFYRKIQIFLKSLFWHIYSGFPKSDISTIKYRYNICIQCNSFDANKKCCNECGCLLSSKKRFMNKLAWADQSCPLSKWQALD